MNKKIGTAFICFMLSVYIFAMHNKYYDISYAKYVTWVVAGIILVLATAVSTAISESPINLKLMGADYFAIGLVISELVAFALSNEKMISLTGQNEKRYGLYTALMMIAIYFFLSRIGFIKEIVMVFCGIGLVFASLFSVIQFCGYDLLNLMGNIAAVQKMNFLGPLGNTGFLGQYAVIVMPIAAGLVFEESKLMQILGYVAFGAGFMAAMVSNTDAAVVGLVLAITLIVGLEAKNIQGLAKICGLLIAVGVAGIMLMLIISISPNARSFSGLLNYCLRISNMLYLIAAAIILLLFCNKKGEHIRNKICLVASKVVLWGLVAITIIAISVIIYSTLAGVTYKNPFLSRYLIFTDNWGTGRGFLWKTSLRLYSEQGTFLNKIFGIGQGLFRDRFTSNYSEAMRAFDGSLYDDAHNFLIQFLVGRGIFGAVMLIGMIVSSVIAAFKSKDAWGRLLGVSILAGALTVNMSITQCITTVLVVCVLGMSRANG